jgi:hypothetical protein
VTGSDIRYAKILRRHGLAEGGEGSGFFGHAGRPGRVGGSASSGGGGSSGQGTSDSPPFGDWEADVRTGDVRGYRGKNPTGIGFGATEGRGMYIAKTPELARFFAGDEGTVEKVPFKEPRNPLVVDGEELYLLTESDKLEEPISDSDSPWLRACKQATQKTYEVEGKWDADAASAHLTDIIRGQGHDAVYIRAGSEEWVVLFEARRGT